MIFSDWPYEFAAEKASAKPGADASIEGLVD
jgi:hypothetical protein